MVVDSSVVVAILIDEPDQQSWLEQLARQTALVMAAPTVIEIMSVLLARLDADAREELNHFLTTHRIKVAAFTEDVLEASLDGLSRYGKGRHAAKLNFGDCISYGLAKALDAPLLFKGTDFQLTDVRVG